MKIIFIRLILLPVLSKAQSTWDYNEYIDKMTSKTVYSARITSANKLKFAFPYDGGSSAMIEIGNINGSNQIVLSVSKGQLILI